MKTLNSAVLKSIFIGSDKRRIPSQYLAVADGAIRK